MKQRAGLQRLVKATKYSLSGLTAAFRNEAAFRLEVYFLPLLIPAALWLGDSGIERALMLGTALLVLLVELLNSAIEAVVDRVGSEQHELSGRAKDLGSAAVLVSLILLFVTWLLVLI